MYPNPRNSANDNQKLRLERGEQRMYEPHWMGKTPNTCDICMGGIIDEFFDSATRGGSWMTLCTKCHPIFGQGLGEGIGQHYKLRKGKFYRVVGSSSDNSNKGEGSGSSESSQGIT